MLPVHPHALNLTERASCHTAHADGIACYASTASNAIHICPSASAHSSSCCQLDCLLFCGRRLMSWSSLPPTSSSVPSAASTTSAVQCHCGRQHSEYALACLLHMYSAVQAGQPHGGISCLLPVRSCTVMTPQYLTAGLQIPLHASDHGRPHSLSLVTPNPLLPSTPPGAAGSLSTWVQMLRPCCAGCLAGWPACVRSAWQWQLAPHCMCS